MIPFEAYFKEKYLVTTVEIMVLVDELIEAFPWTAKCVETIDVTNIGSQYDLKPFMAMTEDDFAW